jgi:Uma2 family endonuclease
MNHSALRRMTADAFLDWDLDQPEVRHELIDGRPVAMTGAKLRHDLITANVLAELRQALRGTRCRVFTADVAVRIPNGNVRRPDAGVHCVPLDLDATYSAAPRLLAEVVSPSTRDFDRLSKLEEYKSLPTLDVILLIETTQPEVVVWSRDGGRAWTDARVSGRDAVIDLPALGIRLALGDLHDGIDGAG